MMKKEHTTLKTFDIRLLAQKKFIILLVTQPITCSSKQKMYFAIDENK